MVLKSFLLLLFISIFNVANSQNEKHKFYLDGSFPEGGLIGLGYCFQDRLFVEFHGGIGVGIQWIRSRYEHLLSYGAYLQLDAGIYLYKGKHEFSGLMLSSFWNLSKSYDKDLGGWYDNGGYYDLFKVLIAPRDFFGKSNFYWEVKMGIKAYSFRDAPNNYISPYIYPSIGYMKRINFNK